MIYTDRKRKKPLALIVDDDSSLRILMTAALKKFGFDAIEAQSGGTGIELFKSKNPDIVLMDVRMPDMDGFEACRIIRQSPEGKFTQIIMVSGLEDSESIKKAFEAGANDFVTKPVSLIMLGYRVQYMSRAGNAFRELHVSKSRFAKIQELAKIGNWQMDLISSEFHCSPAACKLLGLDCTESAVTIQQF